MINISQHALVPYSGYVRGYYNAQKNLIVNQNPNLRSNKLMPAFGINVFQLFNFPKVGSNFATLKMYDPYSPIFETNGIVVMTTGDFFSTTRSIQNVPLDVRVIGWCNPNAQVPLNLNRLGYSLDVQEDELI